MIIIRFLLLLLLADMEVDLRDDPLGLPEVMETIVEVVDPTAGVMVDPRTGVDLLTTAVGPLITVVADMAVGTQDKVEVADLQEEDHQDRATGMVMMIRRNRQNHHNKLVIVENTSVVIDGPRDRIRIFQDKAIPLGRHLE